MALCHTVCKKMENQLIFPEAMRFLVVKDDDQFILLDNNLADTPILDPKSPVIQSTLYVPPHMEEQLSTVPMVNVEVEYIAGVIDGRGTPFESKEAALMLLDHMVDIGHVEGKGSSSPETISDCFNDCVISAW